MFLLDLTEKLHLARNAKGRSKSCVVCTIHLGTGPHRQSSGIHKCDVIGFNIIPRICIENPDMSSIIQKQIQEGNLLVSTHSRFEDRAAFSRVLRPLLEVIEKCAMLMKGGGKLEETHPRCTRTMLASCDMFVHVVIRHQCDHAGDRWFCSLKGRHFYFWLFTASLSERRLGATSA